jgi:UDP-2-acetamido-3-amino-2,3-dideoxy-glucuronate N-acetyltransferase
VSVHSNAIVPGTCVLGENVVIEEGVILGEACLLGHNVVVKSGTRVGADVQIGENTVIGRRAMRSPFSALPPVVDAGPAVLGAHCRIGCGVIIYAGAVIGDSVMIADQATVREAVSVGEGTIVGRGVSIENRSHIGRRCKLETNAYITAWSELEDFVFVAPMVTTTNDNYMARSEERKKHYRGVTIRRGGRVGANATVLPGVVIEADGVVAAGAVVTRDVPSATIVAGVPARSMRSVPDEQLLDNQEDLK